MADTGAPWNIPYVEPTDLVRDYPAADEAMAEAVAAGLTAAGNAGIGSNVVQTVKTDTFTASVATGTASSDVTGLTVSITPTADTSKVLVDVNTSLASGDTGEGTYVTLFRDGTAIYQGDADATRQRVSGGGTFGTSKGPLTVSLRFVDSPATTSAVTYSIRVSHGSGTTQTVFVNRSVTDTNSNRVARGASSITAIEVAA